ncbi:MAG TPA: alpha-galactosidase [Candidatus Hydrogenedentes bacterium]|nr:alpha-galactosidase [Candidatus Hydrogenedentota bacterium]HPC16825.1 alpha-galactosidase [Candidatus Hydrogenedentota bacterium]HRT21352.1 alpha-galactosidase [Candidatus Hydrogenedentota bacterium]HRT66113.1 alpha-galactosidase [Candidatus Hydrogenedentota bacterium]
MDTFLLMFMIVATGVLLIPCACAAAALPEEMAAMRDWTANLLGGDPSRVLSFQYGGRPIGEVAIAWKTERTNDESAPDRIERVLTISAPVSGLVIRCCVTEYKDFPAVEWVLYLKNAGDADTPIISDILPIDAGFVSLRAEEVRLHHAKGSDCRMDDFAPLLTPLGPTGDQPQAPWIGEGNPFRIESQGGRSSCGALPFFNLDMGAHGVIGAIGWTGDWAASFHRTDAEVRVRAGMKRTHLKLLPGEEIRTPRIMLLFWNGDRMRGHNLLRQFILTHHSPTVGGKPAQAPICNATWGGNFIKKHIEHGQWWVENKLPMEYLWVDAGWFGDDEAKEGANVFNSGWGRFVGDWHANPGYFPEGLKPLGQALNDMGLGFLLWLEPERVFKGTKWQREHPELMLGPIGDNSLLDLGNPEARKMLTEHLAALITEGRIGCYRQDFNMDPRPFWDAADAPDRVGMSEIKHITGLYAMWDELRQRFPDLLIDNCSSGGRRIDLEMISRSMPLWRSDVQCWPGFGITGVQAQTQALGLWVPLSLGCCDREDTYTFRSALGPGIVMIMYDFEQDVRKHFSTDWLRKMLGDLQTVRKYFLGDFYPLLSFSLAQDTWSAWQFHRSDLEEGMVLALRRSESPFSVMMPTLHGLDESAEYEFRDLDTGETVRHAGKDLAENGIELRVAQKPGSRLLVYRKM